jgi:HSP20 family molecular chaperone IbpA
MNAGVQHVAEPLEAQVPRRRATSCEPPVSVRLKLSEARQSTIFPKEPMPIDVVEEPTEYKVVVPLSGIEPRRFFVLAMPRSLLIEMRLKSRISHLTLNALVSESVDHRISREFNLPVEIEQGGTTARVCGEFLEITARKSEHSQQACWSELIHFDTRPSSSSR